MRTSPLWSNAAVFLVAVIAYVLGVVIGRESDSAPSGSTDRAGARVSRPRQPNPPGSPARDGQRAAREKERARGSKIVAKQSRKVAKYAKKSRGS